MWVNRLCRASCGLSPEILSDFVAYVLVSCTGWRCFARFSRQTQTTSRVSLYWLSATVLKQHDATMKRAEVRRFVRGPNSGSSGGPLPSSSATAALWRKAKQRRADELRVELLPLRPPPPLPPLRSDVSQKRARAHARRSANVRNGHRSTQPRSQTDTRASKTGCNGIGCIGWQALTHVDTVRGSDTNLRLNVLTYSQTYWQNNWPSHGQINTLYRPLWGWSEWQMDSQLALHTRTPTHADGRPDRQRKKDRGKEIRPATMRQAEAEGKGG